jgi:hypothetical protein
MFIVLGIMLMFTSLFGEQIAEFTVEFIIFVIKFTISDLGLKIIFELLICLIIAPIIGFLIVFICLYFAELISNLIIKSKTKKNEKKFLNKSINMEKVPMFHFNCQHPLTIQEEILLKPVKITNAILTDATRKRGLGITFIYNFKIARFNFEENKYAECFVQVKDYCPYLLIERYLYIFDFQADLMEYKVLIADMTKKLNHAIEKSFERKGTWEFINQMKK